MVTLKGFVFYPSIHPPEDGAKEKKKTGGAVGPLLFSEDNVQYYCYFTTHNQL